MAAIEGHVEDGWGKAADAFRRNFDEFDDLGAAVSVYHEGQVVIDLWGGVADSKTGSAWNQDTIVNIFSTSKGVLALCALMLVDRGQLDLDARVVDYWPEFGAEGKDGIPVHWLLSHRSGLPVFDDPPSMTAEEAAAWFPIVRALGVGYFAVRWQRLGFVVVGDRPRVDNCGHDGSPFRIVIECAGQRWGAGKRVRVGGQPRRVRAGCSPGFRPRSPAR